jgi:hypothetical protein
MPATANPRLRRCSSLAGWRRPLCCTVLLAAALCAPGLAQNAAIAQWAVIVNGDDSFTHNRNVEIALGALGRLGYPAANTFLLSANPRPPAGGGAVLRAASRRALSDTLAALRARMHPGDLLLIYLTGHGIRFFGHALLELESGSIGAGALAHDVSALPFDQLIVVADQCYSGAFVKAFVELGRNVVAVSSADDRHEVRCEPFVRPFWAAATPAIPEDGAAGGGEVGGGVSVEAAFKVGAASLAAGPGHGSGAQYAASGSCKGRANLFAVPPRP